MLVEYKKLEKAIYKVALKAGTSEEEAAALANSVIDAELRGLSSHGLVRVPSYVERIEMGLYAVKVQPEILKDAGALLLIDGKNAIGAPLAMYTMKLCIERAKQYGVCFAAVCHGNHFGMGATYTKYAAEHDMLGFAVANANAWVTPTGGNKKKLGTNPLSFSAPAEDELFLLDMATSEAAQGKVVVAEKKGVQVPPTWGVDATGKPSTDPSAILHGGALLPFGGPKGYGISLYIELLCSALAGGVRSTEMGSMFDRDKVIGTGFFMGAIDPSKLVDIDEFKANVQSIFADMRDAGDEEHRVFIPNEIENGKVEKAKANGIEVTEAIYNDFMKLADRLGVEADILK